MSGIQVTCKSTGVGRIISTICYFPLLFFITGGGIETIRINVNNKINMGLPNKNYRGENGEPTVFTSIIMCNFL